MMKIAVIIPALNPSKHLISYTHNLLDEGVAQIIIVNDGSSEEFTSTFKDLESLSRCTVLSHDVNCGKGRALKTGFTYFLRHFNNLCGVITADADGQHAVEDVCAMAKTLETNPKDILLGVRDFSQSHVPKKSLMGNRMTSFAFKILFRYKIEDTQTGLRGIPASELSWIMKLKGERYEYEVNMLISAIKRKIPLREIQIQTLYFDNNSGSYYKAVKDSLKIFTRMLSGFFTGHKNGDDLVKSNEE